jgi:large subunit ribosomal protein L17
MRHGRKVKKLGRTESHRKAMLANMAASLVAYQTIRTTDVKAKEVKRLTEKLITLAKRGGLHAHRQVYDVIKDRKLVKKLFDEIGPKFQDRTGGYARISKLGPRKGDGAPLSVVELLLEKPHKEEKKGKKEKAGKKAKPEKPKEPKAKKERKTKKMKAKAEEAKEEEETKVEEAEEEKNQKEQAESEKMDKEED